MNVYVKIAIQAEYRYGQGCEGSNRSTHFKAAFKVAFEIE